MSSASAASTHLCEEEHDDVLEVLEVESVGTLIIAPCHLELPLEHLLLCHQVLKHLVRLLEHLAQALELRAQPANLLVALRLLARHREELLLRGPTRLELRLHLLRESATTRVKVRMGMRARARPTGERD